MPFHLRICQPLDSDNPVITATSFIDIDPDITSLQFTTVSPGGFGALNVGMQSFLTDQTQGPDFTRLQTPQNIPPRAHIELYAGSQLLHAGAVMELNKNSSGQADGFISEGYGITAANDDFIQSVDTTPRTSGTILQLALTQAAPLLNIGPTFVDPGVMHSMSEFNALYPADVVNQLVREGGAIYAGIVSNAGGGSGDVSNGVWDFLVYEGRLVYFAPRVPPTVTDYHIPYDDRVQWVENYRKLSSQAAIRYQDIGTGGNVTTLSQRYPAASDPLYSLFKSTYKFRRATILEGGKMRSGAAKVFAQNFIAQRSQPTYAVRITRSQMQGMERQGLTEVMPYMVRAGEWVAIGDKGPLPIISTTYDAFSEVLQVDCGDSLPSGLADNQRLHRVASHVTRGTNPTTGARS